MVVQLSPIVDKLNFQALQGACEGRRWRVAGERAALQVAPRLQLTPAPTRNSAFLLRIGLQQVAAAVDAMCTPQ